MSDTPFRDALTNLEKLPTRQAEVGVVASDRDGVGVAGSYRKPITDTTEVAAEGSWYQKAGWKIAALFRWKGK